MSRTPHRELPTSNATPTRPHTAFADTRHTFAQRHADAGTPVDTLKELLGHDTVRTTLGYYRVTANAPATPKTGWGRCRSTPADTGSGPARPP